MLLLALLACTEPEPPPVEVRPTVAARAVSLPAEPGAGHVDLHADGDGVLAAWIEPAFEGALRVRAARWSAGEWSEPQTVAAGASVTAGEVDILPGEHGPTVYWRRRAAGDTDGSTQEATSRATATGWVMLGLQEPRPDDDVQQVQLPGGALEVTAADGSLALRRGPAGPPITVGERTEQAPALAVAGDDLLLAWQVPGQPTRLEALLVPLAAVPDSGPPRHLAIRTPQAPLGPPFPHDYVPRDLAGDPAPLSAWAGKPVLVNLWATWCPPCMQELPALREVHTTWAPRGLAVVGIAVEDQVPKVEATAKARDMDWTLLQDSSRGAGNAFGTTMLPTTLVYAPDGTLLYTHTGAIRADDGELLAALESAVSSR